ncbi:MAG: hypothetical protein QOH26_1755, partial [Actinomycetota bacterium]|nr:hypothetical protein [Actinomycetota bacterium]
RNRVEAIAKATKLGLIPGGSLGGPAQNT